VYSKRCKYINLLHIIITITVLLFSGVLVVVTFYYIVLTHCAVFKLHVILHLHDHLLCLYAALISLATVRVLEPCRQALLPNVDSCECVIPAQMNYLLTTYLLFAVTTENA